MVGARPRAEVSRPRGGVFGALLGSDGSPRGVRYADPLGPWLGHFLTKSGSSGGVRLGGPKTVLPIGMV